MLPIICLGMLINSQSALGLYYDDDIYDVVETGGSGDMENNYDIEAVYFFDSASPKELRVTFKGSAYENSTYQISFYDIDDKLYAWQDIGGANYQLVRSA